MVSVAAQPGLRQNENRGRVPKPKPPPVFFVFPGSSPEPEEEEDYPEPEEEDNSTEMASLMRLGLVAVIWLASIYAWIYGAFLLPTLRIEIMPGTPFTVKYERCLAWTLVDLWKQNSFFATSVLGFFSIVVPIIKIVCTLWLTLSLCVRPAKVVYDKHPRMINTLFYVASYQMTDLYVGVLFISFFNGDSSNATFLRGFTWFFRYCMTSMGVSVILHGAFPRSLIEPSSSHQGSLLHRADSVDSQADSHGIGKDWTGTWLVSACYFILFGMSFYQPIIEVRTLWNGVAIDRSAHSVAEIFGHFLVVHADPTITVTLVCMNVIFPVIYLLATLVESMTQHGGNVSGFEHICASVAENIRSWATFDVFAWSTIVFVFTVQDPRTLTMPSEGSMAIYLYFGAGFALFFLRWLAGLDNRSIKKLGLMPGPLLCVVFLFWLLVCYVVGGTGSVSSVQDAHKIFNGLDSVCYNAAPVVNKTLRQVLPASYGQCSGQQKDQLPPEDGKCIETTGNKPLYDVSNDNGFIKALWLGGINTVRVDGCSLYKDTPIMSDFNAQNLTRYHLSLQIVFDKISLFLDAKQCLGGLLGCTQMNSADHCCGENVEVNITFGMDCIPTEGGSSFREVELEKTNIDPMMVDSSFLGGSLSVQVIDIGPMIQKLVTNFLSEKIRTVEISWAGMKLTIPEIINHLIAYNSPGSAGAC
jgi:hypothetical protein